MRNRDANLTITFLVISSIAGDILMTFPETKLVGKAMAIAGIAAVAHLLLVGKPKKKEGTE